jgi:hypothetical protein
MPDLTPEQRAKIGQIKTAARALVDKMVDELLQNPDLPDGVDYVSLELRYRPGNEFEVYGWDSGRLDTPE